MLYPGVTAAMVAIEFLKVAVSSISKAAMTKGMSQYVYIAYSNILSLLILFPSTFLFYRQRSRASLTRSMFCRIFLLGLLSCCVQEFMNLGIKNGSPTLTSAISDLTPAFTFLLALLFRMENLNLRFGSSRAKIIGSVVSITGALTLTLYKGPAITSFLPQNSSRDVPFHSLQSNWTIGGVFSAVGVSCLAVLYIVQTWIIKDYPEELSVILISSIFATVAVTILSLIVENDPSVWTLKPDIDLLAIGSAAFVGPIRDVVHIWACRKKGPLYTAMFNPLGIVIAMLLGVSFLGETLHVGSIMGGIIIVLGFYAVLWGKAEEQKMEKNVMENSYLESSHEVPLLINESMDV